MPAASAAFASVEPSPVVSGRPTERRARRTAATRGVAERHRAGRAPLQPVDAYLLVAGAAGQLGQRHGIRGNRLGVENLGVESSGIGSRVSHATLARQNSHNHADRASVPSH